jgi:hypothetical protein
MLEMGQTAGVRDAIITTEHGEHGATVLMSGANK